MKNLIKIILLGTIFITPLTSWAQVQQKQEVKAMIVTTALKYEIDPYLAVAVAHCESRLNPLAKNKHSTAKGVFQFLNGSFNYYGTKLWGTTKGRSALDAEDNIELAMYVMSKRGTKDWQSSARCWGRIS